MIVCRRILVAAALFSGVIVAAPAVPVEASIMPSPRGTTAPFEPFPDSAEFSNAVTAAYNPDRDEYLMVADEGSDAIVASIVEGDGTVIVPPIVIDTNGPSSQSLGNVATNNLDAIYNPVADEFLVSYTKTAPRAGLTAPNTITQRILAQRISDVGVPIGAPTPVDEIASADFRCAAHYHDVAVDPNTGDYVVAYAIGMLFATFDPCEDLANRHKTAITRVSPTLAVGPRTDLPGDLANGNNTWTSIARQPSTGDYLIGRLADEGGVFTLVDSDFDVSVEHRVDIVDATPASFPVRVAVAADPTTGRWMVVTRGTQRTATMVLDGDGSVLVPAAIRFDHGVERVSALGDGIFVTARSDGRLGQLDLEGRSVTSSSLPPVGSTVTAALDVVAAADGRFLALGRVTGDNTRTPIAIERTASAPGVVPIQPERIADTRPTGETVDGLAQRVGPVSGGSDFVLQVAGRAGVPDGSSAAMLNIAAARSTENGFITVYQCGDRRPNTSNLNFGPGAAASAGAFAPLSNSGTTCVFVSTTVELIVDVNGYVPEFASISPIVPERFLESRSGTLGTVDGQDEAGGRVPGGILELEVAGRGSVPADASAVMMNITAVRPNAGIFISAYPCGQQPPNSSNLNAGAGAATTNLTLARIGDDGKVCLFLSGETDLIVDVSAHLPPSSSLVSIQPERFVESRQGSETLDGRDQFGARIPADGSRNFIAVANRGSVPAGARGVMLNVAAIRPSANGFITIYPCGEQPTVASVNYASGSVTSNAVFVSLSAPDGWICIYSSAETDIAVDVFGYTVDG